MSAFVRRGVAFAAVVLTALPLLGAAARSAERRVRVNSNFEGGSIGAVEYVSSTHIRLALEGEVDQNRRNRQANWYYFRLEGIGGRPLVLDLVNLPGEYNFRPNRGAVTADTLPVYSEDGTNWRHFPGAEYDPAEPRLRLRHTPSGDRLWIAHVPPYTNRHLAALLREVRRSPHAKVERVGRTPRGRDMTLVSITDAAVPDAGKKVIWLMFRQHSWETGSSWVGEGVLRELIAPHPAAAALRRGAVWKIFPMADPDGVARGGVRFNQYGYDLNRNWDVNDPRHLPEIHAQRDAIRRWQREGRRIDFFLSLHNTETGEYLEGPDGALLRRADEVLRRRTTFAPTVAPRIIPREVEPGRYTVNQALHLRDGIPAFLMEQMIARNPRLGRLPTREDRLQFGRELPGALLEALSAAGDAP